MKTSIKKELSYHLLDLIFDKVLTNKNKEDWHFHAFNEDYYLIGYYQCSEWLKKHDIGEFEAAGICQQYDIDHFGESQVYNNSEKAVNMLAYIYGDELIHSFDVDTVEELKNELETTI
tara:strand:- start:725 stop:1078 length:354 start_codon:yes stop_codon:yes gene_type:complete